jgi:chromosome segregation ATPase
MPRLVACPEHSVPVCSVSTINVTYVRFLQGLYGRLGDLGSIDAQYDAAASNASGALDNFVVETTEDAQQAVKYLREKSLGLATFIILDKQREHARQAHEKVATPEGAPRLVDLVKCNDDMRVAFFYAFRNTIVAQDIDQASRLGLRGNDRRFARVVTLQVPFNINLVLPVTSARSLSLPNSCVTAFQVQLPSPLHPTGCAHKP